PSHTHYYLTINVSTLEESKSRRTKKKDTEVPKLSVLISVADEAVNEEIDDSLERVATTATSLDVERDRESLEDEGLGKEDASKQRRIADIDANQDIYLVNVHKDKDIFGVNESDEVLLNADVTITTTTTIDDITLAQALEELKSAKLKAATTTAATTITAASSRPKAKGIVIQDQEQTPTPTVSSQQPSQCQEAMRDAAAQTRSERVPKISNDLLLVGVNTPRSGKDSLELIELMELCTKLQQRATSKAKTVNEEVQLQVLVDGKKVIITESTIRRDLQLEDAEGVDCLPNAALFEQLTLMSNMRRVGKDFSRRVTPLFLTMMVQAQEEIEESKSRRTKKKDTEVPKLSVLISVVDEAVNEEIDDSLERVATTATSLDVERDRVKKLKKRKKSRTHGLKRLYKVERVESLEDEGLGKEDASKQRRIADIDANQDIYLVNVHKDKDMFGVNESDEVLLNAAVTITTTTTIDDITLAQALEELKSAKPKAATTTAATTITAASSRPKAKGIEQRLAAKRAQQEKEANIAFIESLDDVQAKIDRAKEKRNRPPTKAQQRIIMSTYMKNIDGWKQKSLKKKSFAEIQELFDKAMKRVNTFVDLRTELVEESSKKAKVEITQEGSLKRTRDDLEQKRSKKQKVKDDKESDELKKCLEIIPDDGDEVTIDPTPLSSNRMLKSFDREDLEVLWRLVKTRFEKTHNLSKNMLGS
nr:hypothetical protein [Tanacetum cinerariifolium]